MLKLEMANIICGSSQSESGLIHLPNLSRCFGDNASIPYLSLHQITQYV